MPKILGRDQLSFFVGQEVGVSNWFQIDQDRIDRFAEVTEDHQWIHTDIARAREAGVPTIAHGFLTLSLLSAMFADAWRIKGVREEINYGCDRLRFLAPVPAGSRVRLVCVLKNVKERGNELLTTTAVAANIEDQARPAFVADWLSLYRF